MQELAVLEADDFAVIGVVVKWPEKSPLICPIGSNVLPAVVEYPSYLG
jgi:hypothetical protein